MEKQEFYAKIPPEDIEWEIERLKRMEYPDYVSKEILEGLNLGGKKILDAGAGPNPNLAEFVKEKRGSYIPLDLRSDFLKEMKSGLTKGDKPTKQDDTPFLAVQGDIAKMPFKDGEFDIVHERLVLMNIPPEKQKKALKELLRVGKTILLLEYDWNSFKSADQPGLVNRIKDLAFQILTEKYTADFYMGGKLGDLIEGINPELNYTIKKFKEEEETNKSQLISLLYSLYKDAKIILKDDVLAEKSRGLIEEVKTMKFRTIKIAKPEIVAAIIKK